MATPPLCVMVPFFGHRTPSGDGPGGSSHCSMWNDDPVRPPVSTARYGSGHGGGTLEPRVFVTLDWFEELRRRVVPSGR